MPSRRGLIAACVTLLALAVPSAASAADTTVSLTFDDGTASEYQARALLESKGFTVAVFNRTTSVTQKLAEGRGKGKNIPATTARAGRNSQENLMRITTRKSCQPRKVRRLVEKTRSAMSKGRDMSCI